MELNSKEYRNVHDWIRRRMNHIENCSFCGKNKKLDNALLIGKSHEKNISNYIKLCRKCHYNYDHPNGFKHSDNAKLKISIASSKRISEKGVSKNFINARIGSKLTDNHKKILSDKAKGEKHPMNKLKESEVIYIFNSTESYKEIIAKYKITHKTVSNIKNRKTWKHLNL